MRSKPLLLRVAVVDEEGSVAMQTVRWDSLRVDLNVRSVISDDLRQRLNAVYDKVGRFATEMSRSEWVESFNVNANPDRETAVWEAIVDAWESFGGGTWLSPAKSYRTFRVVLAVSLGIVDVAAHENVSDDFVRRCRDAYEKALSA